MALPDCPFWATFSAAQDRQPPDNSVRQFSQTIQFIGRPMRRLIARFARHGRFFSALLCGCAAILAARAMGFSAPLLAGGDVFYLTFLVLIAVLVARMRPGDLKRRAKREDEGMAVVLVIILATMAFFTYAVFTALNSKHGIEILPLVLAGL